MKKLLLFLLFSSSAFLVCSAQTTVNTQSTGVPLKGLKSKKESSVSNDQSSGNSNTLVSDPVTTTNNVRYLEYNTQDGSNLNSTLETPSDNQTVIFPIQAEGYTDPNYELNKQRSLEQSQQSGVTNVPEKTDEELILDLQNKIKAIKEGTVVDPNAIQKLPFYEEELQTLLNKK